MDFRNQLKILNKMGYANIPGSKLEIKVFRLSDHLMVKTAKTEIENESRV